MRTFCQQTFFMKYHALFVIFEKAAKFEIVVAGNYRWPLMGRDTCINIQTDLYRTSTCI